MVKVPIDSPIFLTGKPLLAKDAKVREEVRRILRSTTSDISRTRQILEYVDGLVAKREGQPLRFT